MFLVIQPVGRCLGKMEKQDYSFLWKDVSAVTEVKGRKNAACCLLSATWVACFRSRVIHELDTQHSQSSRGDRSEHVSCDVGEGFMYVVSVLFPPNPHFYKFPKVPSQGNLPANPLKKGLLQCPWVFSSRAGSVRDTRAEKIVGCLYLKKKWCSWKRIFHFDMTREGCQWLP